MKRQISIRSKLIVLVSFSLGISGFCTIFFGAQINTADKTAYIYDYAASEVSVVANSLDLKISPLVSFALSIEADKRYTDLPVFTRFADSLGFRLARQEVSKPQNQLYTLGAATELGGISVGFQFSDGSRYRLVESKPILEKDLLGRDFSLCMIRASDLEVLGKVERANLPEGICDKVARNFQTQFKKGTQEFTAAGVPLIVSYESIVDGNFWIISVVPSSLAFATAKLLVLRSSLLSFALFFLTLGISLLSIRLIIVRVQELVSATEAVSRGEFSLDLAHAKSSRDELGILADAFQVMSEKISFLLTETATKARMEKELETATEVQRQFLPHLPYESGDLKIQGMTRSASECGGDYWQFAEIGEQTLFLFGDVTGHGVPAALLTASIHGVFSSVSARFRECVASHRPALAAEMIATLARDLNRAVFESVKGESNFPCIIGVIHTLDRRFSFANFGHPPQLVWDAQKKRWSSALSKPASPLGTEDSEPLLVLQHLSFEEEYPASIFFYTDGLFDQRQSDHKKLSKRRLMEAMSDQEQLPAFVMKQAEGFFGKASDNYPDDITLVEIQFAIKARKKSA